METEKTKKTTEEQNAEEIKAKQNSKPELSAEKSTPKPNSSTKPELSAEELKELLQRTQANFENYRKQMEKRIEEIKQMAAKGVLLELLSVLDNFELALKQELKGEEFVKGIELIYAQLISLLENNQVTPIETKERNFDPYLHEALLKVESDQPSGKILEEFQKGFILHNQVIRPAKVKISAGKKAEEKKENKSENNTGDKK